MRALLSEAQSKADQVRLLLYCIYNLEHILIYSTSTIVYYWVYILDVFPGTDVYSFAMLQIKEEVRRLHLAYDQK